MNRLGTGRSVPQSTSRNVFLIGIGGQHGLSQLNSWIGSAGHGEPQPSSIDEGSADVNTNPESSLFAIHNIQFSLNCICRSKFTMSLSNFVTVSVAQADSI